MEEDEGTHSFRFYENQYPAVDELVMVRVKSITDVGAYVSLLEYNNIEGMIMLSELSRRRIRSVNKLVRVGRNEVVVVLRVDSDKGYIDLSKRRVLREELGKCEERFLKSCTVNSILRHTAEVCHMALEDLYKTVAWPLDKIHGHSYDAFKKAVNDPDSIFDPLNLDAQLRTQLLNVIARRLTPQPLRFRATVEVSCFTQEGIEAVKDALTAGMKSGSEENPIHISVLATPKYCITTQCMEKAKGIEVINTAIAAIEKVIIARGGRLMVTESARAVEEPTSDGAAKHDDEELSEEED